MISVSFNVGSEEFRAGMIQFYANSKTARMQRLKIILIPPTIYFFAAILTIIFSDKPELKIALPIVFVILSIIWIVFYPKIYDRRVMKITEKMFTESKFENSFGIWHLTLSDESIQSISPIGEGKYPWSSFERITLTDKHLFIFLIGSALIPIPRKEIGEENVIKIKEFVNAHIQQNN